MNQALPSLHRGSFEITLTVPLQRTIPKKYLRKIVDKFELQKNINIFMEGIKMKGIGPLPQTLIF